ncbi:hypothetical protein DAEQUDRAFT_734188 [Daedalea quercina L-15889]|uniref:Uncharacterized protein n=1 Tax=Daedalea quercina L-15889 TaxID=1314783 RepID=A0A165KGY1_9APHY|nr:hypothetical protein DAEQUDRAFT_734188 [Daedalea quercina L-15889]
MKILARKGALDTLHRHKSVKKRTQQQIKTAKTTAPRIPAWCPHHGTNLAALRLTAQIRQDAVLSKSYGYGYNPNTLNPFV